MMKINKKSAPQRAVLEIIKTGHWGHVEYLHRLECGHTETRKRVSGTKYIACTGCVKAKMAEDTLATLASASPVFVDTADIHDVFATEIATKEQEVGRMRASLAAALGVTVSDVELIVAETETGEMVVSQAMVFLGPSAINNLIKPV
jgi:hypothetical protein